MAADARIIVVVLMVSAIALSGEQGEQDGGGATASFAVASVKLNKAARKVSAWSGSRAVP